ncbi:MAG: hypothetical protein NXI31_01480 [bacterium]|nr:hypothetical protein [bacterium]
MNSRPAALLAGSWLAFASCSGSSPTSTTVTPGPTTPVAVSPTTGGGADGLASELLLAGRSPTDSHWHVGQEPVEPAALAATLDRRALDHAESVVFASGTGPTLLGSSFVRRLAGAATAPPDQNGINGNLDETLAAELARTVSFAAATPPALTGLPVWPWRERSAELTNAIVTGDNATWRLRDLGGRTVRLTDVADFLALRITTARRLLRDRTGTFYGATPADGALGLVAMQQALAAEDALFSGAFTNGGPLGALPNPRDYDPRVDARWLPREFGVELDPGVAGGAGALTPSDSASDLEALGKLLTTAVDLSEFANPRVALAIPEVFAGEPFEPPPSEPFTPKVSWTGEIRALLAFKCGQCHINQTRGGFSLASYDSMREGGNKTRALNQQFLIPGNARASLLYKVLTGPPAPFVQMPFNGQMLPAEIALVEQWIDEGALEEPDAPPSPPRPGDDLALVSFRNLVTLHLDSRTGALHHRHDGDAVSGIATARATGRALTGLAGFARAWPDADFAGRTPERLLGLAASHAVNHLLRADGQALDAVAIPPASPQPRPATDADLAGQAALTAGLFAAWRQLRWPTLRVASRSAATRLLSTYHDGAGNFSQRPGQPARTVDAATLALVLTALRPAAANYVPGAADARSELLQRLAPTLAFAEWDRGGEVLGDGIADTDGNGVTEPAFAGGAFGRLPVLADRLLLDPTQAAATVAPTWSEHVRPLLLQRCGECHLNGNALGDYRLDTPALLRTPGESQGAFPMLVPGDAEASFLFEKITARRPRLGAQMPYLRPPLDAAGVERIRAWIDAGATTR